MVWFSPAQIRIHKDGLLPCSDTGTLSHVTNAEFKRRPKGTVCGTCRAKQTAGSYGQLICLATAVQFYIYSGPSLFVGCVCIVGVFSKSVAYVFIFLTVS